MKMKSTLAIACAILLLTSCKKICEYIPEHGSGHNNGPSRLKEVASNTSHMLLYYDGAGLIDSIRLTNSIYSSNYLYRYVRHGNTIDSLIATLNGGLAYVLMVFHYDAQGRIKDYMRFPRPGVMAESHYALTYDQQGDVNTILRWNGPYFKSDTLKHDGRHNVTSWVTRQVKNPFMDITDYTYDSGANPLYIKDIFVAMLDVGYAEFLFSPNNTTQRKEYIGNIGRNYSIQNQYDSRNRLVKKIYREAEGGQGDTLEFRYY